MHTEQFEFFKAVAEVNAPLIDGARVLEIGSYNVNGTIRDLFSTASQYTGVDLTEGPGVDVVGYGHELDFPDDTFDITLSGECFEHDPHWRETFTNMVRMTRPGGLVVFTCASRGRLEHGTTRTRADHSPGTQAVGLDYYQNLNTDDFRALPLNKMLSKYQFWYQPTHHDLFFVGIRAGGDSTATIPDDAAVDRLRYLTPLRKRVLHAVMRGAASVLPDQGYQSLALRAKRVLK